MNSVRYMNNIYSVNSNGCVCVCGRVWPRISGGGRLGVLLVRRDVLKRREERPSGISSAALTALQGLAAGGDEEVGGDAAGQDALHGASAGAGHVGGPGSCSSQFPQKVESLLGSLWPVLCCWCSGAGLGRCGHPGTAQLLHCSTVDV